MSTPTPRTDAVYLEHRHWANEDEATEAIEDFRDLARTLEHELNESRNAERLARVQLGAEREKVRVLRAACESICEEWGKSHDANPIGAGQKMETIASKALEKLEDAT